MKPLSVIVGGLALALWSSSAVASEVDDARSAFKEGSALAKDAQWGAALAAFERSSKLRPSAGTTYNVAVCERALGRYVQAKKSFLRALEERKSDELREATVADITRFIGEIDGLLGSVDVTLAPADASIAVDGQPLERAGATSSEFFAGTLPAGPGKPPGLGTFRVVADPGAHVFVVSREGFADAVKSITLRPGEKAALDLTVERLPAALTVSANRNGAVVNVDKLDVGVVPVELSRPAGKYHVTVRSPGFVTYEVDTLLSPGQKTELRAKLEPEKPSVFSRWWFWTAASVVLAGAAVTTYAVTRPEPERPPVDGGGLGWAARAP